MLIRVTEQCNEECSHCMICASPEGKHMSVDTFARTRLLFREIRPRFIGISGGEPTLHPGLKAIVTLLLRERTCVIVIMSNGSFIDDPEKFNMIREFTKHGVHVQIRTHPKFYKNYERVISNKKKFEKLGCDLFSDGIDSLTRLGRAQTEHLDLPSNLTPCANTALVARQFEDPHNWIETLEMTGRGLCKPSIGIDGTVYAGETQWCVPIGKVTDTFETLHKNARNYSPKQCNRCGGWDALIQKYPQAKEILDATHDS